MRAHTHTHTPKTTVTYQLFLKPAKTHNYVVHFDTQIFTNTHTHILMHTNTCMQAHTLTHKHTQTHIHADSYLHTLTHIHICQIFLINQLKTHNNM